MSFLAAFWQLFDNNLITFCKTFWSTTLQEVLLSLGVYSSAIAQVVAHHTPAIDIRSSKGINEIPSVNVRFIVIFIAVCIARVRCIKHFFTERIHHVICSSPFSYFVCLSG
jgi:hypothetical protein